MKGASVIICCYNSALRIDETLKYALAIKVPNGYGCEVLVIDSNSSDNTKLAAEKAFAKYGTDTFLFRIIKEPTPGLTSARQLGIRESRFNLLLFCDDDNHLEENYLIEAKKIFENNPALGIIGGWCRPKLTAKPRVRVWIEDFYGALAMERVPGKDRFVNWVFGAGMVIKKEIFSTLLDNKIQLLLTDRLGTKQTSGGDSEFCLLSKFVGYQIYYSSLLKLDHCISAHRLSRWNFLKTAHQNFYPVMYLQQLEYFVLNGEVSPQKLYRQSLWERLKRVFYFASRCILGRHHFYSFISFYSNVLFVLWMLGSFFTFLKTHAKIKANLSI